MKRIQQFGLVAALFMVCQFTLATEPTKVDAFTKEDVKQKALIARGEYLVYGPAACVRCHGSVDQLEAFEDHGKRIPLGGGRQWTLYLGTFNAPNISSDKSYGIGNWTDKELFDTIRSDINQKGQALIPMMEYSHMADDDVNAIIAYLKQSPPINKPVPASEWSAVGSVAQYFLTKIKKFQGNPSEETIVAPKRGPTVAYGRYLAEDVAQCVACHTKRSLVTGEFSGPKLAGGTHLPLPINPKLDLVVPNITPHGEYSLIKNWTEADFVQRFREGLKVKGSHMPWGAFEHMSEDDVKAIWLYIQTLPSANDNPGPVIQVRES